LNNSNENNPIRILKQVAQDINFKDLVELSVDMIYRLNEVGEFVYVNPIATEITGYLNEELIGISFLHLVRPDFKNQYKKFYANLLEEKIDKAYLEVPVRKKDGSTVWLAQNIVLQTNINGFEMLCVARDVSLKVKAIEQTENWISRLLILIENLQEGVLMEDENRKITLVNRAFCDLFSVRLIPEDLIGKSYVNAQNHIKRLFSNPAEYVEKEQAVVNNQNIRIAETFNLDNGRIYERDYVPIYIETGFAGNLWKYRDSTDKIKTKRDLIKSERKYKSVIDAMRLGLMEVDKNDKILNANEAFCEILAYKSASELIGRSAFDTLLDGEQQRIMKEQMAARSKEDSTTYEIKAKKADGGHAWMLISGTSLLDENGEVIGSMGIHLDISVQKRIAIELEEKNALKNLMEWQEKAMENLEEKVTERTVEVTAQKEQLENINEEITRSINYALRIQQALLPKREDVIESLPDSFILFKPRDIVSGDFYYFNKADDGKVYLAAVDSTGHGVPGGFMSMLGTEKLNDAVMRGNNPGEILSILNKSIKNSLNNSDTNITLLDGYDMALCEIDPHRYTLNFSGALRPLWIIRKESSVIEEIKPNRNSIGGRTSDSQVFETHFVQLQKGDSFYLFTDGFTDQFGMTDRKLSTKRLSEALLLIKDKPMEEQNEYLDTFFNSWCGTKKQTDDVLLIGVKF
jgi:PAS domain S-box-containing protein